MSSAGSSTSPMTTRAPSSRRASTMPRPMPPAPPVTTATLPLRSCTPPLSVTVFQTLLPSPELEHPVPDVEHALVAEAFDVPDRRPAVQDQLEIGHRAPQRQVALGVLATDLQPVGVYGDQPLVALGAVKMERLTLAPARF